MGNDAAKKTKIRNEKAIAFLIQYSLIFNVAYLVLRFIVLPYFDKVYNSLHIFFLIASLLLHYFCYSSLSSSAKPVYDAKNKDLLISGGEDITMKDSVWSYYWDILYITWVVQLLSLYSDKFWWIYVAVPIYAIYLLWKNILSPYIFAPTPEPEDNKKKKEKKEKKKYLR